MPKEKSVEDNGKLYEMGFHLVSTIPTEKTVEEFNKLKDLIKKYKGEITKEGEVKAMNLAYSMTKKIAGQNHTFSQSYFGWVKFNMQPQDVVELKNEMNRLDDVLRFIVVKTVDDYEHSTNKLADEMSQESNQDETEDVVIETLPEAEVEAEVETELEGAEIENQKDIDQVIDDMVK